MLDLCFIYRSSKIEHKELNFAQKVNKHVILQANMLQLFCYIARYHSYVFMSPMKLAHDLITLLPSPPPPPPPRPSLAHQVVPPSPYPTLYFQAARQQESFDWMSEIKVAVQVASSNQDGALGSVQVATRFRSGTSPGPRARNIDSGDEKRSNRRVSPISTLQ